MFNLLTKWFRKTTKPDGKVIADGERCPIHGDEPCACNAAVQKEEVSRRRFMVGLGAALVGIGTGIIKPSTKIFVPSAYPDVSGYARALLRPLQQPLYDTEIFNFKNATQITFFSRPENPFKKRFRLDREAIDKKIMTDAVAKLNLIPGELVQVHCPVSKIELCFDHWAKGTVWGENS